MKGVALLCFVLNYLRAFTEWMEGSLIASNCEFGNLVEAQCFHSILRSGMPVAVWGLDNLVKGKWEVRRARTNVF